MSEFWKRVDEELDYIGKNRTYLANKCGFSLTNIGQGIKLGSTPSAETAVKIAKELNVTVEYLVTGIDDSNRNLNCTNKNRIEKDLVTSYTALSKEQKELVKILITTMSMWGK